MYTLFTCFKETAQLAHAPGYARHNCCFLLLSNRHEFDLKGGFLRKFAITQQNDNFNL